MMYGMYLSASGALANSYRMDVQANNLANAQTPGFKPHVPFLQQRDPERIEDRLAYAGGKHLLERLGGGVFAGPQETNFKTGQLTQTNRPLDMAFSIDNQFLAVQDTDGQTYLTRNGKLMLNNNGQVVTPGGHLVLNAGGSPIVPGQVDGLTVNFKGQLVDRTNKVVAQMQIAEVEDLQSLEKRGENLFANPNPILQAATPVVQPGYLEGSAVDPIQAMMALMNATKAMTGNAQMMTHQDRLMDQAINQFGRMA